MGSLAAALEAASPPRGPKCSIHKLWPLLDDDDQATLQEWLANPSEPPHAAVSRALKAEGHQIGAEVIRRHRKGECLCGPGLAH